MTTLQNQTTEKTFNKKVKAQTIKLIPTAKKFKKLHVPGIGYVFYIKDEKSNTVGKVYKNFGKGMIIIKNN
tara:strand:- start:46 stop:258 length:213 start_codon:yes stop_codon:yes gene_type:complete